MVSKCSETGTATDSGNTNPDTMSPVTVTDGGLAKETSWPPCSGREGCLPQSRLPGLPNQVGEVEAESFSKPVEQPEARSSAVRLNVRDRGTADTDLLGKTSRRDALLEALLLQQEHNAPLNGVGLAGITRHPPKFDLPVQLHG